jgi:hypothetical protein
MGRPSNAQLAERKLLQEAMKDDPDLPQSNAVAMQGGHTILTSQQSYHNVLNNMDQGSSVQTTGLAMPMPKPKTQPKITYAPVSESAPYETIWNKHRFRANIPTAVRDVVGGNTAAQMIESAKGNIDFMVEGFPRAAPRPVDPETPEQYKTYAVGWIRHSINSVELMRRWKNERDLREECGVGTDDEEYLHSILNPRHSLLKESEKLQAAAVND